MKEKLSEEALRMCRQCHTRLENSECNTLGMTVTSQNMLAEKGECDDAVIAGPVDFYNPQHSQVVGRMRKLENGDWVFESGQFNR
jgi:hypothetical protein